jgi:hypothetical protein
MRDDGHLSDSPCVSQTTRMDPMSGDEVEILNAARARPHDEVTTQGHVLSFKDFVSTLVFEATIHHLDMTDAAPDQGALTVVRRVLDGLLGDTADWDDRTYALKGTGREPLTDAERARYGDRFPLAG